MLNQKEVARITGFSERTVRRKFPNTPICATDLANELCQ